MRAAATLLLSLAAPLLAASGLAHAADGWSAAPLGASLGLPVGAAPPPGLYLDLSTGSAPPPAPATTAPTASPFAAAGITYVPGIKILGADYSASIRPAVMTPFFILR